MIKVGLVLSQEGSALEETGFVMDDLCTGVLVGGEGSVLGVGCSDEGSGGVPVQLCGVVKGGALGVVVQKIALHSDY